MKGNIMFSALLMIVLIFSSSCDDQRWAVYPADYTVCFGDKNFTEDADETEKKVVEYFASKGIEFYQRGTILGEHDSQKEKEELAIEWFNKSIEGVSYDELRALPIAEGSSFTLQLQVTDSRYDETTVLAKFRYPAPM